jgi:hypothetical protein
MFEALDKAVVEFPTVGRVTPAVVLQPWQLARSTENKGWRLYLQSNRRTSCDLLSGLLSHLSWRKAKHGWYRRNCYQTPRRRYKVRHQRWYYCYCKWEAWYNAVNNHAIDLNGSQLTQEFRIRTVRLSWKLGNKQSYLRNGLFYVICIVPRRWIRNMLA